MQVRGFPHSYGVAQTEITSDGTPTGGRLGKVSTKVVDSVLGQYNDERISSIRYFGTRPFENINETNVKKYMICTRPLLKIQKLKMKKN